MLDKLKLRHLEAITQEKIDYASLMVDIYGYKNSWLGKKLMFLKLFSKTYSLVEELKDTDPAKIEFDPEVCNIKCPQNIDTITFAAMMEIHSLMDSKQNRDIGDLMAEQIAIACYSENNEGNFDKDTLEYKNFKTHIDNSPAISMIGLYNHIYRQVLASAKMWQERFLSVQVEDKDYENAGGKRMGQFNVITTIKNSCNDFNVSYEQAWQLSYALTQTNSYSRATEAHIQKRMSDIKEERMKRERKAS